MAIYLLLFFLMPWVGVVASVVAIARGRNSEHSRHFHNGARG